MLVRFVEDARAGRREGMDKVEGRRGKQSRRERSCPRLFLLGRMRGAKDDTGTASYMSPFTLSLSCREQELVKVKTQMAANLWRSGG